VRVQPRLRMRQGKATNLEFPKVRSMRIGSALASLRTRMNISPGFQRILSELRDISDDCRKIRIIAGSQSFFQKFAIEILRNSSEPGRKKRGHDPLDLGCRVRRASSRPSGWGTYSKACTSLLNSLRRSARSNRMHRVWVASETKDALYDIL